MARLTLEQLGLLIKQKRGNKGLRKVAAEMNVSAATLSRVEAGKTGLISNPLQKFVLGSESILVNFLATRSLEKQKLYPSPTKR